MTSILSSLFGLAIAVSAGTTGGHVAPETWVPLAGDRVVVDTRDNVGYIVREDGNYTSFPVLTGQRRVVRYIGRTYNAATPTGLWTVESMDVKGRSMTFGETGTFLRLYDDGEKTAYGFHGHLTFQKMLAEGDRFRSMGCVLVDEAILKLLVETYELNGKRLEVATAYGVTVPEAHERKPDLSQKPSWLGL